MLARLDTSVPQGTRIAIVEGRYNDVLAGRSAAAVMASIERTVAHLVQRRLKTVLCGFYNAGWDAVGRAIARQYTYLCTGASVLTAATVAAMACT
jgi:hypothetical protein